MDLYFQSAGTDYNWGNPDNWWENSDATTPHAALPSLANGDNCHYASAGSACIVDTGTNADCLTCDMDIEIMGGATIASYGGTFSGAVLVHGWIYYGPNMTGAVTVDGTHYDSIQSGVYTGSLHFTTNSTSISGATMACTVTVDSGVTIVNGGGNTYTAATFTGDGNYSAFYTPPSTYDVTFDNQGHGTTPDVAYGVTTIAFGDLPSESADGYFTFSGWSTSPTGDVLTGDYSPTSNSTLYAIWVDTTPTGGGIGGSDILAMANPATGEPSGTGINGTSIIGMV